VEWHAGALVPRAGFIVTNLPRLALPKEVEHGLLTAPREWLVKIGAIGWPRR